MDWLDGLSYLQLGGVWLVASLVLALVAGRLAPDPDPDPELPVLYPRAELDFNRFEAAMAELRGHLDDLQGFASAPPGIGQREINRLGGGQDNGNKARFVTLTVTGRGRVREQGVVTGAPPPSFHGGAHEDR